MAKIMKNKWKVIAIIFIIATIFFCWAWLFTGVSVVEYNSLIDDYEFCVNVTYEWEFAHNELFDMYNETLYHPASLVVYDRCNELNLSFDFCWYLWTGYFPEKITE